MKIEPASFRGGRPLFSAKVGTGPSNLVAIKRKRNFEVGDHIKFVELSELKERSASCRPPWHGGIIEDIRMNMLFISRW